MTWSLTLTYAGRSFTFADIEPQLTAQFSVFSGIISEVSEVSLTLDLGIDVPQAVENGYDLSGTEGVLSLDGVVVLNGRAIRPLYGDPTESEGIVRLTLRESVIDDTAMVPGVLALVDTDTWVRHDPNVRSRVYPEVFGAPGRGVSAGSPAYLVDTAAAGTQYVLIAGHTVGAVSVKLHNTTGAYVESYTVLHVADGRGHVCAVIDIQEHAAVVNEGDELWIEWTSNARSGLAGDVLAHWMSLSAVRVDPGKLAAAIQGLNSYVLAGYVDQRVAPLEWVADNLLPILPISLSRDVGGLFPVVYEHSIVASEAVAHLVVGADCAPISPVTYEGDPLTELRLSFAPRADTGDYLLTAAATEETNEFAAKARLRYRGDAHDGRYSEDMATDIVYDGATGDRIVASIMERRALRARTVQYECSRAIHGALVKAGRFVTITDPGLKWTAKPAWVTSRTDTSDGMTIGLLIKDELSRDMR